MRSIGLDFTNPPKIYGIDWWRFTRVLNGKVGKKDLLKSPINYLKLEKGEIVSKLHVKLKELINNLLNISESISNKDMLRSRINVFSRIQE